MSAQMKVLLGAILGVFSILPARTIFFILPINANLSSEVVVRLACAVLAVYFTRQAKNTEAKVLGMSSMGLFWVIVIAVSLPFIWWGLMWLSPFV